MQIVEQTISIAELKEMSFEKLVKAVIDVEKDFMVVDVSFHADQEEFLLERGSLQENLWGINLVPNKFGQEDFPDRSLANE